MSQKSSFTQPSRFVSQALTPNILEPHQLSRRPQQCPNLAPVRDRLGRVEPMLEPVLITLRSARGAWSSFLAVGPTANSFAPDR